MNTLLSTTLATSAIVGVVLVGANIASAEPGDASGNGPEFKRGGNHLMMLSEVLDQSVGDIRDALKDVTVDEFLAANGYEDKDTFFAATLDVMRDRLSDKGLTQEEIDEKIAFMTERHEFKQDVEAVRQELLGMDHDALRAAREDGKSFEDILKDAGYEDVDAFHAAVQSGLAEAWAAEGVSQEDIDARLEKMNERHEERGERGPKGDGLGEGFGEHKATGGPRGGGLFR